MAESHKQPSVETTKSKNDPHVRSACLKARKGDYRGAIAELNDVIPRTWESLYYRGCAHLELGELTEALRDFDQAIELNKRAEHSCLYYKRAFACHLVGRYAEAILNYTMFIECDEKRDVHKGYLGRGLVHTDLADYKKALEDIEKANELKPMNTHYQYCLSRAETNIGREHDANNALKTLRTTVADSTSRVNFEGHYYCGVALYESEKHAAALEEFQKALLCHPTDPQSGETHFYMGLAHYSLGKISKAKGEFEQTLQLNKNHDRALFKLGMMYGENDDSLPLAIEYLTRAHKLIPHKYEILYERGEIYYRMGKLGACLNDKRRAMQMKQSDSSARPETTFYELLLVRVLSLFSSEKSDERIPKDIKLIEAILHDKLSSLSREQNDLSLANKHYHQAMKGYQSLIYSEKEKAKDDQFSVLSFALIFHLCNENQHPIPALTAIDQLDRILDEKPELEKKFNDILKVVKQKEALSPEALAEIIQMLREQKQFSPEAKDEKNEVLFQLLISRVTALEKIVDARDKVKVDLERFRQDRNGNRKIFYRTMRVTLSHTFAAMAVTSGVGGDPIIRHDRTGTQNIIGSLVSTLGGALGGLLPTGGGVVSGAANLLGGQIQEDEHGRFQDRMSLIASVGTTEELNDVARQIALELAIRYETQILSLVDPDQVKPCCCCFSCRLFQTKRVAPVKTDPPNTSNEKSNISQSIQVAQFAIAFLQQAVLNEKSEDIGLKDGMDADDLVKSLVRLMCRAKPGLKAKIIRRIQVEKDSVLFHTPINDPVDSEHVATDWHLHEFYWKPAIRLEEGQREKLPWTNVELYGHRGGTEDEHDHLLRSVEEKQKKRCCC